LNINIVSPSVTTAPLEATHVDLFGDETKVNMSNISTTYLVPSTPNTRIHKDHSLDHVWTLVDLPYGNRDIGTKWIYINKKDERGIVVRNKARLATQGYIQEERIDYDEVFALVARIEAIRLFLASGTPMETSKPLLKDTKAKDVDVHLYRLMIGSLMYLTASRPDIMFAVCACARFQVTPKVSHLRVVKKIFRYLKGQPKLGILYLKDSPFDLEAYTNSDYAGASLDRKSTTEVQTPGSEIFILLAVGTPSTGSGNLYCLWELSPSSANALCILFPTILL
nr:uncharacterized mitochondrial protein AtMg00810-like [Tanacetum cinerariifolium]